MIEDIIKELKLSPVEVNEISQLMHTSFNYNSLFSDLIQTDYSKTYEELFRKCADEYLKKEDV